MSTMLLCPQLEFGVLNPFAEEEPEAQANLTAFRKTLEELGWT